MTHIDVPTTHEQPPPALNLRHLLVLNIPLPSIEHAQTVYRVLSVDRPLRPKDAFTSFCVTSSTSTSDNSGSAAAATASLDISLHTSSIRQMRLSSNAILDDVSLILETMEAFPKEGVESEKRQGESIALVAAAPALPTPSPSDQEFELNGTGRAG